MSLGALATVLIFVALHGTGLRQMRVQLPTSGNSSWPGTYRIVLRDQVGAAVTKTGCAHPSPASRRCTSSDGARFLAPLVGRCACGKGSRIDRSVCQRHTARPAFERQLRVKHEVAGITREHGSEPFAR